MKKVRKFLRDRGRLAEGIVVAVIGGAILLGLTALVTYFVKSNPIAHVETWLIVLVGVAVLAIGCTLGALFAADGEEVDHADEAKHQETAAKYTTTGAYIAHFRNTLASVLTGKLVIGGDADQWGEEVGRLLCEQPCSLIGDATGHEVAIGLWIEKTDPATGKTKFEIVQDANHTTKQARQFAGLKVDDTWLHYVATQQKSNPEDSPVAARDLTGSADGNADLKLFKSMEYKEIRAFAVDLHGTCLRLVALTKVVDGFSATEDVFFLLLWCVVAIAAAQ